MESEIEEDEDLFNDQEMLISEEESEEDILDSNSQENNFQEENIMGIKAKQSLESKDESENEEFEASRASCSDEIHRKAILNFDSNLLKLAKRAKMNSYLKIRIFCLIMSREVKIFKFKLIILRDH